LPSTPARLACARVHARLVTSFELAMADVILANGAVCTAALGKVKIEGPHFGQGFAKVDSRHRDHGPVAGPAATVSAWPRQCSRDAFRGPPATLRSRGPQPASHDPGQPQLPRGIGTSASSRAAVSRVGDLRPCSSTAVCCSPSLTAARCGQPRSPNGSLNLPSGLVAADPAARPASRHRPPSLSRQVWT
jgi:hypothetical protein